MSEISCPFCGRPNPEDNLICDFCGSNLDSIPPEDPISDELLSPETPINLDQNQEGIPAQEPEQEFDFLEADIPDEESGDQEGWLDLLQTEDDDLFFEDSAPDSAPEFPDLLQEEKEKPDTDWLEKIKRLDQSSDQVDDDSSFPDWLAVSGEPDPPSETEISPAKPEKDEIPEWLQMDDEDELLNEFLKQKADQATDTSPPPPEEEQTPPIEDQTLPPKFPSWATEQEQKEAQEPQLFSELEGERQNEADQQGVDPFEIEDDDFLDALFDEDLPGWLTDASDDVDPLLMADALAQAELPGWVEAMRPVVESSGVDGLDEDEDYLENYGPLAGIPSILPAEAESALDIEGAKSKNLDLTVTKNQQNYVSMLNSLIEDEGKVKPISKPPPLVTQRVLRWLIAIVLLVVIGGVVIFGGESRPDPALQTIDPKLGVSSLNNIINSLEAEDPVLIAFDYQPATAGEMTITAAAVVDHLMDNNTYLSLISTQPTGPALAENFLQIELSDHEYRSGQNYVNLGYLPGQAAGLLSFVFSPKEIIQLAYNGSNAWESPPLVNVNRLDDFQLVLVITDDPDNAKLWIEQIEPYLGSTPLGMVVSAQVEPLILPYYQTIPQPLNGYAAGIIDGMKYELLQGEPGPGHKNWLSFNIGIIISVGTIFISGLANGILALFTQHRRQQSGEDQ
jgi:hypothetical protein